MPSMKRQDHPSPFLTIPTPSRSLGQPSDLCHLLLHSIGSPTPTIHWSKLRSPLPWQHQLEGDTLIIPRVAQQDSGQYICNATSPTGHAEATIALHVESKALPRLPWAALSILRGSLSPLSGYTLDRTPGTSSRGPHAPQPSRACPGLKPTSPPGICASLSPVLGAHHSVPGPLASCLLPS